MSRSSVILYDMPNEDDDIHQLLRLADSTTFPYQSLYQQDAFRTVLKRWSLLEHMEQATSAPLPARETATT